MFTLKVAFRNITKKKKRSFLLAGAIAFGMLVITMINALTGGWWKTSGITSPMPWGAMCSSPAGSSMSGARW